jgi:hypothetical protein
MSKQGLPPDLRATMKLFAEAQLERLEAMSPEELDASLRAQGLDPDKPFDLEKMLPPEPAASAPTATVPAAAESAVTAPAAPVVPLRPKGRSWRVPAMAWIALPAAAAILFLVMQPKPVDPVARAADLRAEATKDCDQQRWKDCARLLDEANDLDPAGESEERVARLRQAIALSSPEKPGAPGPPRAPPRFDVKPPPPPHP